MIFPLRSFSFHISDFVQTQSSISVKTPPLPFIFNMCGRFQDTGHLQTRKTLHRMKLISIFLLKITGQSLSDGGWSARRFWTFIFFGQYFEWWEFSKIFVKKKKTKKKWQPSFDSFFQSIVILAGVTLYSLSPVSSCLTPCLACVRCAPAPPPLCVAQQDLDLMLVVKVGSRRPQWRSLKSSTAVMMEPAFCLFVLVLPSSECPVPTRCCAAALILVLT